MRRRTLHRTGNPLALPLVQLETLGRESLVPRETFQRKIFESGCKGLRTKQVETLQVNVGKVCNQTCAHCHVDAGPDRKESMSRQTAKDVIRVLKESTVRRLDITGGAPEMNANFRYLVEQASLLGKHIIDRCNLTILTAHGFTDLPAFLADHNVEIVASLPCYLEENCDAQRGDGVFQKSIIALQELNRLGYGQPDSPLLLTLVYNPVGPSLPPEQSKLESSYREQLLARYGVRFTRLFTITNMPISRFLDDLLRSGRYESYMQKLISAFNPATLEMLMCRNTLSVDWTGRLFDCDFNQMLDLPISGSVRHIRDLQWDSFVERDIVLGNHCFGCTAGAGSSCQGAVV